MDCTWNRKALLTASAKGGDTCIFFSRLRLNSAQPGTQIISLLLHWTTQNVNTLLLPFLPTKGRHGIWGALSGPTNSEIPCTEIQVKKQSWAVVYTGCTCDMETTQHRRGCPLQPQMSFTDQNHPKKIPSGKHHAEVRTVWQGCQSCYTRHGSPWATAAIFETLSCVPLQHMKNKSRSRTSYEQRAHNIRNDCLGRAMLILEDRKLSVPACWED